MKNLFYFKNNVFFQNFSLVANVSAKRYVGRGEWQQCWIIAGSERHTIKTGVFFKFWPLNSLTFLIVDKVDQIYKLILY